MAEGKYFDKWTRAHSFGSGATFFPSSTDVGSTGSNSQSDDCSSWDTLALRALGLAKFTDRRLCFTFFCKETSSSLLLVEKSPRALVLLVKLG